MIKQYTTPKVRVLNICHSEILCVSAGFGDGETDVMHTKQKDFFSNDEEDMWEE